MTPSTPVHGEVLPLPAVFGVQTDSPSAPLFPETPIAFRVDNVIRAVSGYSSVFLCRGQLYRDANGQIGAAAQEPGVSDLADDLLRDAELYIR